MAVTLQSIREAQARIKGAVCRTPCTYSLSLSRLCGASIYCKLDHLQMTGSFKERGARNKLVQLTEEQKKTGVIANSAGNHALGLAYHGQLLGIPVTVVMPKFAPLVKVTNCRSFGAEVIIQGETFHEARQVAFRLAEERKLTYIPGFDDEAIIDGQGTVGLEILEDVPDVDAIVIPVGGGGLIAGVAAAVKALRPQTEIIGVEPTHAASMIASLAAGKVVQAPTQPTLADGLAVAEVGKLCFDIVREKVDRMVEVDETAIATAILRLLEMEKMVVEGAGAAGLAAMLNRDKLKLNLEGKKVVLVLCGGNIDVTMIARVIDRGLASDGRMMRLTAHISDRPGGLAKLLAIIAEAGGSIQEVVHDRHFGPSDVALVTVRVVIETRDHAHISEIAKALEKAKVPHRVVVGD